MERLTKWNGKKWVLPQGRTSDGESYWRIIAERLAEYENASERPHNRPNVNAYWDHVREIYPDARFDFWYSSGELHFYRNADAERLGEKSSCFAKGGTLVIENAN